MKKIESEFYMPFVELLLVFFITYKVAVLEISYSEALYAIVSLILLYFFILRQHQTGFEFNNKFLRIYSTVKLRKERIIPYSEIKHVLIRAKKRPNYIIITFENGKRKRFNFVGIKLKELALFNKVVVG